MKKLLSLLVAVLLLVTMIPAMAEGEGALAGYVYILHTNDIHGSAVEADGVWGYAAIAQVKNTLQAMGADVLLVDAGDYSQGAPIVNLDQGASAIDFMNAVGYDLACVGNHEFDWGTDNLLQNAEKAQFPIVCANMLYKVGGETVFGPNAVFEFGGRKIGIFGLATPETMTKAHPDKVKGVTFLATEELYACAQAQIDELTEAGCDIVICVGHLGIADESIGNRSIDVIANTTGLTMFIDGHSHDLQVDTVATAAEGETTVLVQTGTAAGKIGVEVFGPDGYVSTEMFEATAATKLFVGSDEYVASIVNDRNDAVNAQLGAAFATTAYTLNGERAPGVRTEETNLGDFAADAILWAARQAYSDEVVASLTNGGGIRATIAEGDITMLDMKTVFPYGNTVAVLQVTGAELLEALEAATWSTPDAIGAFPQVSGIVFTIDTSVEYVNGEMYPDSTYYAPANPGSRVTIESVGGEAFDPEAIYTIATNDFTAAGGDTYYAFKYAYATSGYNTQLAMEDALIMYVQQELGGNVGEAYAAPAGRIIIK